MQLYLILINTRHWIRKKNEQSNFKVVFIDVFDIKGVLMKNLFLMESQRNKTMTTRVSKKSQKRVHSCKP